MGGVLAGKQGAVCVELGAGLMIRPGHPPRFQELMLYLVKLPV